VGFLTWGALPDERRAFNLGSESRRTYHILLSQSNVQREREREKFGEGLVRETTMVRVQGNDIFSFEGSQAVPASPAGRVEACVQD
jgi:hypothetical protein